MSIYKKNNVDISKFKEFYKYEISGIVKEESHKFFNSLDVNDVNFYSYQKFLQNIMSPFTPYDKLFVNHSTGSGKTLGALGIALKFFKLHNYQLENQIYILGFQGTKNAFRSEIKRYSKTTFPKEFSDNIEFMGYKEMQNHIEGYKGAALPHLENTLFICDEIHNTYNNTEVNQWGDSILKIIDSAKSTKFVFLSATPINTVQEIVNVINLLNKKEDRVTYKDIFEDNMLTPTGVDIIKKKTAGKISYVFNTDTTQFPAYYFKGVKMSNLRLYKCDISEEHYEKYNTYYDTKNTVIKDNKHYILDTAKLNAGMLNNSNLKKYSSKYFHCVDLLKKSKGKSLIFHKYLEESGLILFSKILLMNGFIKYGTDPDFDTICAKCSKTLEYHKPAGCAFSATTFIHLNGSVSAAVLLKSLKLFEDRKNKNGYTIRIALGSLMIKESFSFKNIRSMYILSRPSSIPILTQIIGRAIRFRSHHELPMVDRYVDIYLMVSTYPKKVLYEEKKYSNIIKEYKIISIVENILHENAVDSSINCKLNSTGKCIPLSKKERTSFINSSELNALPNTLTTYDRYYLEDELEEATYAIKMCFLHISEVWKSDDLFEYINNNNINSLRNYWMVETNIDKDCFEIALNKLTYQNDYIYQHKVFSNRIVVLYNDYYILIPTESRDNPSITASISNLFHVKKTGINIDTLLNKNILNIRNNDIHNISKWMLSKHENILKQLVKFKVVNKTQNTFIKNNVSTLLNYYNNRNMLISFNIIPSEYRRYYKKFNQSKPSNLKDRRFRILNSYITRSCDKIVGYIWFEKSYIYTNRWVEIDMNLESVNYDYNSIMGFYDIKSTDGEHPFKILVLSDTNKDNRKNNRGIKCQSMPKKELAKIYTKITSKRYKSSITVNDMCKEIHDGLIKLELKARQEDSDVKYFFSLWEYLDMSLIYQNV